MDYYLERKKKSYFIKENASGSPRSILLAFSQFYVKHDLRKKIKL
jgi:hypothetical protein